MTVPTDLKYTSDHDWVRLDGDTAVVGVTAYAAEALGDVVYVELPDVGARIEGGRACGEIESTKSVSDLLAPTDGEVLEVNSEVVADPGLVNLDPYGRGWLIRVRMTGDVDLMDASAYDSFIGGAP